MTSHMKGSALALCACWLSQLGRFSVNAPDDITFSKARHSEKSRKPRQVSTLTSLQPSWGERARALGEKVPRALAKARGVARLKGSCDQVEEIPKASEILASWYSHGRGEPVQRVEYRDDCYRLPNIFLYFIQL
jgi:hypothetical protein